MELAVAIVGTLFTIVATTIAFLEFRERQKEKKPSRLTASRGLPAPNMPAPPLVALPPPQVQDHKRNNLPIPLTSFIGREREIEEVKKLLATSRLLTLTGTGGVGKTRLALKVAGEVLDAEEYSDGVWIIDFAPLSDSALVPKAIALVLGVQEKATRSLTDLLIEYLGSKNLLLVLDNCEHMVEACARLAETLLRANPRLKILATSREALGIDGEFACRIPSMALPDVDHLPSLERLTEYEAVKLFITRAALVAPTFKATEANAPALAQICDRLDGIPLAIELAAARVKMFSVEQIRIRLDDCFLLLSGGSRTALQRHQTLRATIDWSYDLLSINERMLLRRLSVFVGGWTFDAAEFVCAGDRSTASEASLEVIDLLSHLVDKSLVNVEQEEDRTRYRFLETVRQYAREKLLESGENERVRKRHIKFFVKYAEEASSNLGSAELVAWLDRLESEIDNMRGALEWGLAHNEVELVLRLGTALIWFWIWRVYLAEGKRWLEQIVALSHRVMETEQASFEHRALSARAMGLGSMLAYYQGEYTLARSRAEEGLRLAQEIGNKQEMVNPLYTLGRVALQQGDPAGARAFWEERLTITQKLGEKNAIVLSLLSLGNLALNQGEYEQARVRYEESLAIARELGNKARMGTLIGNLGHVALYERDFATARKLYSEALVLLSEVGDKRNVVAMLVGSAGLAREQDHWERASQLCGAVEALSETLGSQMDKEERVIHDCTVFQARTQVGEANFSRLWNEGGAMTWDQAIQLAKE